MIEMRKDLCYNKYKYCGACPDNIRRRYQMKHIQTLNGATLKNSAAHGGCGECQTSCQSACKTSCTVANQKCENDNK